MIECPVCEEMFDEEDMEYCPSCQRDVCPECMSQEGICDECLTRLEAVLTTL